MHAADQGMHRGWSPFHMHDPIHRACDRPLQGNPISLHVQSLIPCPAAVCLCRRRLLNMSRAVRLHRAVCFIRGLSSKSNLACPDAHFNTPPIILVSSSAQLRHHVCLHDFLPIVITSAHRRCCMSWQIALPLWQHDSRRGRMASPCGVAEPTSMRRGHTVSVGVVAASAGGT